jgi:hypothetical protein
MEISSFYSYRGTTNGSTPPAATNKNKSIEQRKCSKTGKNGRREKIVKANLLDEYGFYTILCV